MKKFKDLTDYHYDHGYWTAENNQNYDYVLCPEPFFLTSKLESELYLVGKAVAAYHEGMEQIFDHAETNIGRTNNRTVSLIHKILDQATDGMPKIRSVGKKIPLAKVDLMIDKNENLKIAEIDSYNPRGIPYGIFLEDIYREYKRPFSSLVPFMDSISSNGELTWVYADVERYYLRIFSQMKRILAPDGIRINIVSSADSEVFYDEEKILMVPSRMHKQNEITAKNALLEKYALNSAKFAYPLHPWISTKGAMGLISNPAKCESLEEIVSSSFDKKGLEFLREKLPQTVALGKNSPLGNTFFNGSPFVLKKNISSGLKGVWVTDHNDQKFKEATLLKNSSFVAQEFVDQKTYPIDYYDQNGNVKSADWYLRLTAYVDQFGRVVDAEVTGRRTPDVHGAPDCIMLPCI